MVTIRILAQVVEDGKLKGGQEIEFDMEGTNFIYATKEEMEEICKNICEGVSKDWYPDFEYRSHEPVFINCIKVDTILVDVESIVNQVLTNQK
jgi:hypothetical protein